MDTPERVCDNQKMGIWGKGARERGQASIMIAMMLSTFILFFAFVVNTGMLVSAKINLQNAADMAAYAGAATQARQLDHISYLNYEMRRRYKKFLFRYYVIGNRAQKSSIVPPPGGPDGARLWSPNGSPVNDYTVPIVCVHYRRNDNYCQLDKLPKISTPTSAPLDQINETLISVLKNIDKLRQENCEAIGQVNLRLLYFWLYNADPDFSFISTLPTLDPTTSQFLTTLKTFGDGIGLVPSLLILKSRIATLQEYANKKAQVGVTRDQVQQMLGGGAGDAAGYERTIQAFQSAFYTLGQHTFPVDSITMDELLPGDSSQANVLKLDDIRIQFDTYAIDLSPENAANNANTQDCIPKPVLISLPIAIPIGVKKDPSVMTYYAVRLTTEAELLFNPFGKLRLRAYAAAQPFGSRIGPPLKEESFYRGGAKFIAPPVPGYSGPSDLCGFPGVSCTLQIPNLPIRAEETDPKKGAGWDKFSHIQAYNQVLTSAAAGAISLITPSDLRRGYEAAMAANPWEIGKYNIPNHFDEGFPLNYDERGVMAFWAPVFSLDTASGSGSALQDKLKDLIAGLGATGATSNSAATPALAASLQAAFLQALTVYSQKLLAGQGEDESGIRDGFYVTRIKTAVLNQDKLPTEPEIPLPTPMKIVSADQAKTSWNDVRDRNLKALGRTGYSVKFVSFKSLTGVSPHSTDGVSQPANTLGGDSETTLDLPLLEH